MGWLTTQWPQRDQSVRKNTERIRKIRATSNNAWKTSAPWWCLPKIELGQCQDRKIQWTNQIDTGNTKLLSNRYFEEKRRACKSDSPSRCTTSVRRDLNLPGDRSELSLRNCKLESTFETSSQTLQVVMAIITGKPHSGLRCAIDYKHTCVRVIEEKESPRDKNNGITARHVAPNIRGERTGTGWKE